MSGPSKVPKEEQPPDNSRSLRSRTIHTPKMAEFLQNGRSSRVRLSTAPKVEAPLDDASNSRARASKVPKIEEEDVKDVVPMSAELAATGSASFHIKGQIQAEQLVHRHIHRCEYCEFTAITDDKLTAHREQKHKIYLCRFCKSEFETKFHQHKHYPVCEKLKEMRKKVKKQCEEIQDRNHTHDCIRCMHTNVKCPICKVVFQNMFDLGDHRKHPCKQYSVRLFACNGCKTQFTTANGLKSHLIAKYNEKDFKCFNTGILSYESMKIPKYTRRGAHISDEQPINLMQNSVTLRLVPIKDEPTLPDEMHDDRMKHALVAAHLLSDFDGTMITEYYFAMRRMFFRVSCPFCGIECRTHAALHSHGLVHHPPHERCFYQCRGCSLTYQTPTGLGQHLKREFDESNATCYNTVSLVRKEDYLGPVTGWNKRVMNKPKKNYTPLDPDRMFNTIDVQTEFKFEDDGVKKEEPDDGFDSYVPITNPGQNSYLTGDREVKEEPVDEIKPEPYLSH